MGFLERVIEEKRREVAEKQSATPIASLEHAARTTQVRDFRGAIEGGDSIIAELKARTPTIERFEQSDNLDALATIYEDNGAAAISIVTDERNFGTSLDTVRRVRERVSLPILVKEFVFDPYQVFEARAAGADAILLIARMLDWDQLTGLLDMIHQLGMSALVETHNGDEMKTALQARAPIVGINNRDLDTMEITLDTTRTVARIVPDDVVLVAESGIHTRADIDDLTEYGADAFLIGGSLLAATNPAEKLREFTRVV